MRPRSLALLIVLGLPSSTPAQQAAPVENVSTFPPRTPDEERRALHVPEGFEVQLVASEPDIHKPMNLAFDARGRLWVTDTVEYPWPAAEGTKPRDTVKVLDDFGPDGKARRIATFADGLNIPIGVLPLPDCDRALVHSIPDILLLADDDGDGKADRRVPMYQSYGFKDTHGMTNHFTWGFDGWIYACHGFSNTSTVHGSDKQSITMQSGNVYRMKADGSHLEYYSHGQVNPFGLGFDPRGDLYSSDCHSRPIYMLLRGAFYPSFGKPDDGLGFGPEMVRHDHGSTAISGLVHYAAADFPPEYRDTIFIGNVVTNRINRDKIARHGSSPEGIAQPDFVWSEDNWFRPVDLVLGPDGALYVADFYNRIIGHYEVPLTHPGRDRERGRIWRIVYRGKGEPPARPRDWLKAGTDELAEALGHENLAVRTTAANLLAARDTGETAVKARAIEAATDPKSVHRRVHGLWLLHRLGVLSDEQVEKAARDDDAGVRVHALRVIGERDPVSSALRTVARDRLNDADPIVKRLAAEALARHPGFANVRPLLHLRATVPADDAHLLHVVRMALRDQLRDPSAWKELGELALNERDARAVADVATGVPTVESARFLLDHIGRVAEPREALTRYLHHIARYGPDASGAGLARVLSERNGDDPGLRAALLKAVQRGLQERGSKPGDELRSLARDLARTLLDAPKADDVSVGIGLVTGFQLKEDGDRLAALATSNKAPEPQRAEAMTALVALDPPRAAEPIGAVLANSSAPVSLREKASGALAGLGRPEALKALLAVLPTAPERLQGAIAAGLAGRPAWASALLDAVAAGKASARLLQEPRVGNLLNNAGITNVKDRLAALVKGLPPADQRVRDLLSRRHAGFAAAKPDLSAGAKVFEKNCAACHQYANQGAKVGPQLDGIGARGVDRLLEDILDPSRNVDQTFRATTLALRDGRVVGGLLLREEGAVLVMADAQGKEVRVPADQVEERTIAPISPMPANFADQIAEGDFYDLIAYLVSSKN